MASGPAEQAPPAAVRALAADLFSRSFATARSYAHILGTRGVDYGLLGPAEAPVIWERHLINCGLLTELLGPARQVADIGSGAGLPGLVLAIQRPDLQVVCIEPLLRRAAFLSETVYELGLNNVEVIRARAQEVGRTFDAVTARAVAPLNRLVPMAMPLVRPGGRLLALKGDRAAVELGEIEPQLRRWQIASAEVDVVGEGRVDRPLRVVSLRRSETSTSNNAAGGRLRAR